MTVERIFWERIHLSIVLQTDDGMAADESVRFFLVGPERKVKTCFRVTSREGNLLTMTINVTNSGINRCIPNGIYKLMAMRGEDYLGTAVFYGKPETLAGWSRNFNYSGNKGVYTVSFLVDEDTAEPELAMLFYNGKSGTFSDRAVKASWLGAEEAAAAMKKPPLPVSAVNKVKSRLKKFYSKWAGKFKSFLYRRLRNKYKHAAKPHILFLSDKNDVMTTNMEALYRRMLDRGLDKDWVIDVSLGCSALQPFSKKKNILDLILIAKANVIIVDDHYELFNRMLLDESTRLIQIWHAGAGFKGVGYSRWGHFGCPGLFSAHRQYSYCISGSKAISHFFSEQFGILDEQIIPTGMPRMDDYLDPAHIEKTRAELREQYPQFIGKRVVLFAPTYRGQTRKTANYPYELIDFEGLYRYCLEKDAVILFKMHPWVPGDVPIEERFRDRFFSMNSYRNINDLFYITDLLITDYSSSMYEFLLMKKPMLFFPFDKNQFATSRGFHRDYDSNVPGKICESFDLLLQAMRDEDYEFEKVERMLGEYFDNVDTHNSDRVIDWLILDRLPQEYRDALDRKRSEVAAFRSIIVPCPADAEREEGPAG